MNNATVFLSHSTLNNAKFYDKINSDLFYYLDQHFDYYIFRYLDQIHGLSDPDPKIHETYLDVEPHFGALIGAQARFQANLILRPDPAFPPLANLTGTTVSFSTINLI